MSDDARGSADSAGSAAGDRRWSNLLLITVDAMGRIELYPETLREYVIEDQGDLIRRLKEILEGFARTPTVVLDAETHKNGLDFSKTIATFIKDANADHTARKAPWLRAGQIIDNRWHELADPAARAKTELDRRLKRFSDAVAAEERRQREEAQRAAAAEAERKRREAEEAERQLAAPAATDTHLDEAIAAGEAAQEAEKQVAETTRAAEAKPAELARTRTDLGALGTLQQVWLFRDLHRPTLDLELLRDHLPFQALEQAVRSFIKAGGRSCRGVTIYEDTALRVR